MATNSDYEGRRRSLLEALMAIACERGLDEVSVREVASEAGVSPAKVQYYFRTKDEMLVAAFSHVEAILTGRAGHGSTARGVAHYLREHLAAWLPTDAEGTALARVWIAFLARAVVVDELAAIEVRHRNGLHHDVAALIDHGVETGEFAPDVDSRLEATLLLALVDGLVVRMLSDPGGFDAQQALHALDAHLDVRPRRRRHQQQQEHERKPVKAGV
ncbi:AcrR family transcriptional regulator [Thermocatellispora tengchongensis]|uniref:AcrR family transcriptional regulator n=1 Tax=Thermocatellispora tengchongensis TaxID=1073253 RepID=A0A840NYB1_9ACTN|nr:TetR/AcrR family transcriptional regulator [Thermocatellispora tengchongensis]MBB5130683.1 AcrR family transcriptional regulator [Thermocatellispora tengchongensis]